MKLSKKYPHLAVQWHPTKNNNISFDDLSPQSNKIFWWKCSVADDHEWQSALCDRTRITPRNCPCCSKPIKKIVKSNCLATTHPGFIKEWSEKNTLSPFDVTYGSDKKVIWICKFGHEYISRIANRCVVNRGCPECYSSKGEKLVQSYLESNNIAHEKQWRFRNSEIYKKSFDFYVPTKNCLIEFQGEQHYKSTGYGSKKDIDGLQKLQRTKQSDAEKAEWCKKNNFVLITIPYYQINKIANILDPYFK